MQGALSTMNLARNALQTRSFLKTVFQVPVNKSWSSPRTAVRYLSPWMTRWVWNNPVPMGVYYVEVKMIIFAKRCAWCLNGCCWALQLCIITCCQLPYKACIVIEQYAVLQKWRWRAAYYEREILMKLVSEMLTCWQLRQISRWCKYSCWN